MMIRLCCKTTEAHKAARISTVESTDTHLNDDSSRHHEPPVERDAANLTALPIDLRETAKRHVNNAPKNAEKASPEFNRQDFRIQFVE